MAPGQCEPAPERAPEPDPSTILIFDWDDTLCPSTSLDVHSASTLCDLPPPVQRLFNKIAQLAAETLTLASNRGTVLIITNSDDGWVLFSASRFLPSLVPILESQRVSIVSARTRYEGQYPGQPLCWKAAAFAHEVNERFGRIEEATEGVVKGEVRVARRGSRAMATACR